MYKINVCINSTKTVTAVTQKNREFIMKEVLAAEIAVGEHSCKDNFTKELNINGENAAILILKN